MPTRRWVAGMGAGSLLLAGMAAAERLTGAARQVATPPAQAPAGQGDATAMADGALLRPAIDLIAAQEIALREHAGAAVREVELSDRRRGLVYEVVLDDGAEIDLDATTGAVLAIESDDDDDDDDD